MPASHAGNGEDPNAPNDPEVEAAFAAAEIHLGPKPDKIVPDIAGWRREHLPSEVFDADAAAYLTVAPDWVCEVLSERTERIDRTTKLPIYRRERVQHV